MFNLLYVTPRSSSLKKTLIVGYFDRKKEDFKDFLDRFLISSSCFVKKSLHSKQLDHKRIFKIE